MFLGLFSFQGVIFFFFFEKTKKQKQVVVDKYFLARTPILSPISFRYKYMRASMITECLSGP